MLFWAQVSAKSSCFRQNGYNLHMPKAALFALLVASILIESLHAQRTGAAFHGNAAGQRVRSGFVGQRGFPNGFRSHDRFGSIFVPYFFPYDEPFDDDQPDAEAVTNEPAPPVAIRTPEPPIPKAQVIEIPSVANPNAKALLPTIFILANGERLEARRFVLTASNLSVSIARQQRTVPLDMLDINATISTNHARGIDLRIPDGPSEISISF
jgi:hypothetical protein